MPPRNKSPKSGKGLASIFHLVRKVHISGGQFTVISPDVEEVEVDMDPDPDSVKPAYEVYYNQLLLEGKGSPLYVPGPDMTLPREYRRRGIGIGDVGVLYYSEGFNFLFNIFLAADDPINEGSVPKGFKPIDYSSFRRGRKMQVLGRKECFRSPSVRKSSSWDSSIFESSATEGAILILPDGGISEDFVVHESIKDYIKRNAEDWYEFVKDKCKLEVKKGEIRLVIGLDKVSSWGIATFAGNAGQSVRLEFKSVRQEGGTAFQMYDWNCDGSARGRAGPEEESMRDIRDDSDQTPLRNQCVFVRTVNFDMSGQIQVAPGVHRIRSDELFSGSPPPGPSRDRPPDSSNGQFDNSGSSTGQSQFLHGNVQHHSMKRAAVIHPSDTVNKLLLTMHPEAQIVITEDADWISVLDPSKDVKFPDSDELCVRLLNTHEICEEDGVVSFKRGPAIVSKSRLGVSKKIVGFMQTFWASVTHRSGNPSQVVVCMGPYGSGKSQLIDCLARTSWANHKLEPEQHPVRSVRAQIPGEDRDFLLVDTRGFDGDSTTAASVLEDVADWLKKKSDIKIFILYFHSIMTNRSTLPPPMHLLTRLCGNNAARQFVFVTTHWDQIEPDRGTDREAELKVSFRPLLIRGATMARFDKTTESAWKVVKPLLSQSG